ncbi:MAG: sulfatase [Opitutaceae bacterium]|nr:sulfatase [Opitutaceae bacterium]
MNLSVIIRAIRGQLILFSLSFSTIFAESLSKPNILIIGIDDLRPELNCYGAEHIHSPNIDRLAARGTLFERAYSQYAVCGPSRSSMFTGCRPDTTEAYNNKTHFRNNLPDTASLPEFFKENGYKTYGFGKILHNTQSDPQSWSEPQLYIKGHQYASPGYEDKQAGIDGYHASNKLIPLFEGPDVDDDAYRDGLANIAAIEKLKSAAEAETPFLLFMGYQKPHTPFNAPKRYWDLYDRATLPLAPNPFPPQGAPDFALSNWRYVHSFGGVPDEGPFPEPIARKTLHAYFACVSYIDSLIGELIAALEATGETDNTIIALWSDHGYQLGDHGMWCKHTNFETSTRIPFILVDPRSHSHDQRSSARVELIDMYPTLAEIAGLEAPANIDGKSLAPLLVNPNAWDNRDTMAFSQFNRAGNQGYSIRTKDFRYTEWRNAKTEKIVAQEFYNHQNDPQENVNVANSPELKNQLDYVQNRLHKQWPLK